MRVEHYLYTGDNWGVRPLKICQILLKSKVSDSEITLDLEFLRFLTAKKKGEMPKVYLIFAVDEA